MKQLLSIALVTLMVSCNEAETKNTDTQSMEAFNEQIRKDSADLAEKLTHIRWEGEMRIKLLGRGIKGVKAENYIDSVGDHLYRDGQPGWYVQYKKTKAAKAAEQNE